MDPFEAFDAVAQELMLTHGIETSQLHKRLRNITKAASKDLPPLQVLYCGVTVGTSTVMHSRASF